MSEVQPVDMKDLGIMPGQTIEEMQDEAQDRRLGRTGGAQHGEIECYVYAELHEQRQHFIIQKADPNINKLLQEHRSKYGHEYGQDASAYYFTERDKKPVVLLGHFKGPRTELNDFVSGKQTVDGSGKVVQELAAHPRCYVSADAGAYGNPPRYITDKNEVLRRIKEQDIASEIRDVGEFSKLRETILENERQRRRV